MFVARARIEGADEREWTYVRRDGSRFPVHLSVHRFARRAGAITGMSGWPATSPSAGAPVNEELLRAKEAAESASRAKSELANRATKFAPR